MKNFVIKVICIALFSIGLQARAQETLYGPTLSYQYQKGSAIKTGGYFAFAFLGENILKTDVTANFTWTQSKFAVIPELAFSFYPQSWVVAPFVRTEITPYTITPKVGISLATILDLDFGYGFATADKQDYRPIKGFTASLRFNIPLNYKLNM
ncbi:hypothetical protein MUB18_04970 [Sphingobacterium sp. PCS056]|jgi:hypothetical protein|uniref:hypothetical protein n=1 Tax=Sphingobacterium TaxID=28453 RepID=UPI0004E5F0DF|nr:MULTISPECIES: hypothetical protein [Sphingobacterium]UPZ37660.1 hypothetical protein MUB18_04970 [Sphingobacterium sp. PCS056]UXD69163.1 hypothetical protein MUK51_18460 [Sphingobacterium faecium]CDS97886.1 conserved exported hypothetical protein [Sphingobacterium sp. PM2-P1-29]